MSFFRINDRLRFFIHRIRERLWVMPLAACLLSIAGAFIAKIADLLPLGHIVPQVTAESVETLLSIMASSMLVIATFAVGSMVSAYASVSTTASPRSFSLVVADDVSQRALSTFIGAFIFSIVGLIAAKNDFFDTAGRFVLFLLTVAMFGMVIYTFVRWVDRIARLGRLGATIEKVERATTAALKRRRKAPALNGVAALPRPASGQAVFCDRIGYVQRIDIDVLQACAEETDGWVTVAVLPGSFVAPGRPLAYVRPDFRSEAEFDAEKLAKAFVIGNERVFDEDPRYGLVVLSQIAGRALSPAVNDPGTAIDVIGILVRLLTIWSEPSDPETPPPVVYDRVEVPDLSVREMFDDAFTAIGRDGSGAVEVMVRLQKALSSLASLDDAAMRDAARHHALRALSCAEKSLLLPEDLSSVRRLADFATRLKP